ncbi:DeoR/GlpR family DNA-binding transcription regulator [Rheinheimera sp.]|uniref:DeoR/GlpR family DNA-binding transcription regulator n=1 Tax=Rheinheimera sp. TaxID=1869214 RepID=UPI003AF5CFA9
MLTPQRQQQILQQLAEQGQVLSKQLSVLFEVSEDTIRRDLRDMAKAGLLQRVYGGALPASAATATFSQRQQVAVASKRAIAKKAAGLISAGQVVIIDGGTTTTELLNHIPKDLSFTVVTHSPTIAVGLADFPLVDVVLIGGKLFKHSVVAVGAGAMESIARIQADLFFMGVTGVHPEAGLTTGDYEEACIKRALAGRAAETVVLASAEKVNAASAYAIGDITIANTLVVEAGTDSAWLQVIQQKGVVVLSD